MTTPLHTKAELDWIGNLYFRIAQVTTRYAFTAPVEPADLEAMKRHLDLILPGGCFATCEPEPGHVRVSVYQGKRRWYQRTMIVVEVTREQNNAPRVDQG